MSDQPGDTPEQLPEPVNPAPSIWDTFAKGRVEKPRDIAEEVRVEEDLVENLDVEKLTHDMTVRFYNMVPGEDPNGMVYADYEEDKSDKKSIIFSFTIERKMDDENKSVVIAPHSLAYELTDKATQREFHSSRGSYPEVFVDQDGTLIESSVIYILGEKGNAEKKTVLQKHGKKVEGSWQEELPVREVSFDGHTLTVSDPLSHQDFAQLKGYLTLYDQGSLTFDPD